MRGRPENDNPHLINQISLRVESLDDLRQFHQRVLADGYQIERVVNHGSAIGCYFKDPEGNTTEVFWRSPRDCWVPTGEPIDLSQPDEVILAEVNRAADRGRDVPVGGVREQVAGPAGS
jgi:catechol-2,3-dioxygenase